jgi:hypothetical protein
MAWWQWLSLLGFFASIIYTIYTISAASASSDQKRNMVSAITNVTIVNTILMLIFGGTAYFYLDSNLTAERPYMILMLHISLLLSIISVSIVSLQKLNS